MLWGKKVERCPHMRGVLREKHSLVSWSIYSPIDTDKIDRFDFYQLLSNAPTHAHAHAGSQDRSLSSTTS
jgi:hypothetical protein